MLLYPQERSPQLWQAIWESFTQNLLANQARGTEATGVAIASRRGPVIIEKQDKPASLFIEEQAYQSLSHYLSSDTVLIMGHTRHPTQGTPSHSYNNHPLQAGQVTGIHNGHIHNNELLFNQFNLPRYADVDSEVIFQLLTQVIQPESDRLNHQNLVFHISDILQHLNGKFTFLAFHQQYPLHLIVVRHQNSLSLHFHAAWGALIFSSSYIFLRKTFGASVLQEIVPKDQVLLFDASQLFQSQHLAVNSYPLKVPDVIPMSFNHGQRSIEFI